MQPVQNMGHGAEKSQNVWPQPYPEKVGNLQNIFWASGFATPPTTCGPFGSPVGFRIETARESFSNLASQGLSHQSVNLEQPTEAHGDAASAGGGERGGRPVGGHGGRLSSKNGMRSACGRSCGRLVEAVAQKRPSLRGIMGASDGFMGASKADHGGASDGFTLDTFSTVMDQRIRQSDERVRRGSRPLFTSVAGGCFRGPSGLRWCESSRARLHASCSVWDHHWCAGPAVFGGMAP